MDMDEMIIAVYCTVDDAMKQLIPQLPKGRVRERGPATTLCDSEVLTMEVVGSFWGLHQDSALFTHFKRHHAALFPALLRVHRTGFARQAANLWKIKEKLWQHLLLQVPRHAHLSFIDSVPLPVCRFARATFCSRFRCADVQGVQASYGYDHVARQTFWGLRLHFHVVWPGVVRRIVITPAHVSDVAAAPELLAGAAGIVIGDRNYHAPALQDELEQVAPQAAPQARLLTPPKKKRPDEDKRRSKLLSHLRYRIETVFGQWCQRFKLKDVQARDTWHLANRLLRVVLCHTLCVLLNWQHDLRPLQFAKLLH